MNREIYESNFAIYLSYTFSQKSISDRLVKLFGKNDSFEIVEYEKNRMDDHYSVSLNTIKIEMSTIDIVDITDIFIERYKQHVTVLNKVALEYNGFCEIEIIAKIHRKQMPAVCFSKSFLKFTNMLHALEHIDFDMY